MARSSTNSSETEPPAPIRRLVLGIGNDILGDDRVGLLAARRIAARLGDIADHTEAAVATIDLALLMSGYDVVHVVDAVMDDALRPGTTVEAAPDDLPGGFGFRSFHTMPFVDALRLAAGAGMATPERVVVHGMVVRRVTDFTEALTPEVAAAWRPWADSIAAGIEAEARSAQSAPSTMSRRASSISAASAGSSTSTT
jgi:hydrogenase maturation protease